MQNELPYLVEHIEYMRVLGVNRIVVCDDRSTDNTTALQVHNLYAVFALFWPRSRVFPQAAHILVGLPKSSQRACHSVPMLSSEHAMRL